MSRLGPEPRIHAGLLDQYIGQTVRIPVKVKKLHADTATVETANGGEIGVHIPRDMHLSESYVELIGSVKDDGTVKALTKIDLGKELDMKAVLAVIDFSHSPKGQGVLA